MHTEIHFEPMHYRGYVTNLYNMGDYIDIATANCDFSSPFSASSADLLVVVNCVLRFSPGEVHRQCVIGLIHRAALPLAMLTQCT